MNSSCNGCNERLTLHADLSIACECTVLDAGDLDVPACWPITAGDIKAERLLEVTCDGWTQGAAMTALSCGLATIERVAKLTGWPVIDGCLVPEPDVWHATDGNAEIGYVGDDKVRSGKRAAEAYVECGDWGDRNETKWITVRAWLAGINPDGDEVEVKAESHTITLEPEEPTCESPLHEWKQLSLRGNGGGVIIRERCEQCGVERTINTWAQDPETGEQGLHQVTYHTQGE